MDKKIVLACYLLLESSSSEDEDEYECKTKRIRRHSLFVKRDEEGVFNTMIKRHLLDNDTKFLEYFRLTPHLFHRLLAGIESKITKLPSIRYPQPIEPKMKLCVTLRWEYFILCNNLRVLYTLHGRTEGLLIFARNLLIILMGREWWNGRTSTYSHTRILNSLMLTRFAKCFTNFGPSQLPQILIFIISVLNCK